MAKRLVLILGAFCLIAVTMWGLSASHRLRVPELVSRTDPPRIRFEETRHELGSVQEGIELPYTFKIHNDGGEPLLIRNVSTTCGCTILNLQDKAIAPGKTADLQVVMDTSMKQGHVSKAIDVFSNDPKAPKQTVYLGALVLADAPDSSPSGIQKLKFGLNGGMPQMVNRPDPHAGLSEGRKTKIFTGNCAVCHVQQGKGKVGEALFRADCAICHGMPKEGKVGPALIPGAYEETAFTQRIQETIRYGSKTHRSMPGFSQVAGGPLNDAQIASLMQYLHDENAKLTQ